MLVFFATRSIKSRRAPIKRLSERSTNLLRSWPGHFDKIEQSGTLEEEGRRRFHGVVKAVFAAEWDVGFDPEGDIVNGLIG